MAPSADPLAVIERMGRGVDLVLIEGWKDGPLPKIELQVPGTEPLARDGTVRVVDGPEPPSGEAWDELVRWLLQTANLPERRC